MSCDIFGIGKMFFIILPSSLIPERDNFTDLSSSISIRSLCIFPVPTSLFITPGYQLILLLPFSSFEVEEEVEEAEFDGKDDDLCFGCSIICVRKSSERDTAGALRASI